MTLPPLHLRGCISPLLRLCVRTLSGAGASRPTTAHYSPVSAQVEGRARHAACRDHAPARAPFLRPCGYQGVPKTTAARVASPCPNSRTGRRHRRPLWRGEGGRMGRWPAHVRQHSVLTMFRRHAPVMATAGAFCDALTIVRDGRVVEVMCPLSRRARAGQSCMRAGWHGWVTTPASGMHLRRRLQVVTDNPNAATYSHAVTGPVGDGGTSSSCARKRTVPAGGEAYERPPDRDAGLLRLDVDW